MGKISWKQLTYDIADATREAYGTTDKIALIDLPDMISALYVCNGKIHFSSTAPTAADGNDNDVWVVI
jgi:hypothetical protein